MRGSLQILGSACLCAASLLAPATTTAQPREADLRPADPVSCKSNQEVVLRGRLIDTAGTAVQASGNCEVRIIDSRIVGSEYGVKASGNADVVLENSSVEGLDAALRASGNAEIRVSSTVVVGEKKASGNAEIREGDGVIEGQPGSINVDTGGVDIGVGNIRIDESGINMPGISIDEDGVRVGDVRVDSSGQVVVGAPGASVIVDGDFVRIDGGGSVVEVNGDWRTAGTSVYTSSDVDSILVELGAEERNGAIELQLAGDVLFDFNSAAVRRDAAEQLSKLAHVLRVKASGDITVIGHTDSVGDEPYNQKLSEQRAVSVMHWLNSNESIPAHMMRAQGLGESKPVAYNETPDGSDNPEGRAKNRRVELRFASE